MDQMKPGRDVRPGFNRCPPFRDMLHLALASDPPLASVPALGWPGMPRRGIGLPITRSENALQPRMRRAYCARGTLRRRNHAMIGEDGRDTS